MVHVMIWTSWVVGPFAYLLGKWSIFRCDNFGMHKFCLDDVLKLDKWRADFINIIFFGWRCAPSVKHVYILYVNWFNFGFFVLDWC